MYLFKYIPFFLFMLIGCKNEMSTEPNQDLFGQYKSSTFIEPGELDGGVDISASGGYLKLSLNNDFKFTAELFIPDSIGSNYSTGLKNYEGNYLLKKDTLKINSQYFIFRNLKWNQIEKQIESFEVPSRGRPFKIILSKN